MNLTHVRVPLVEPFRISSGAVSDKDANIAAKPAITTKDLYLKIF